MGTSDQKHTPRLMRDTVSAAESDLAAATMSWAYFLANFHPGLGKGTSKAVYMPPSEWFADIFFDFKNANTDTCGFSLYGYGEGGPANFICSVDTVTAGTAQNGEETVRYFGDTIGTITAALTGSVRERDSAGSNRIAKINFDARGYKYLLLLFTAV